MSEADVLDRMIDQAQGTINDLRQRLQLEERYLGELCERRRALAPGVSTQTPPSTRPTPNGTTRAGGSARVHSGGIPWHILGILEAAGHEMDLAAIARELEARGVTTTHEDGMLGLVRSSVVRRLDLFERVREGIIDLKSRRPRPGPRASRR